MYIQNQNSKKWEKKLELLDKNLYNQIREDIKKVIFYSNTINGAVYHVTQDTKNIYKNNTKTFFTPEKDINYNFDSYILADFIINNNIDILNFNTVIDTYTVNNKSILVLNAQLDPSQNGIYNYIDTQLVKTSDLYDIIFIKNGTYKDTFWELHNNVYTKTEYFLIKNKINYLNINENDYYDMIIDGDSSIDNYIENKKIYIGTNGFIIVEQNKSMTDIHNIFKYTFKSIELLKSFFIAVGENGKVITINRKSLEIKKLELQTYNNLNIVKKNPFIDKDCIIIGNNNDLFMSIDSGHTFEKFDIIVDKYINFNTICFIDDKSFYIGCNNGIIKKITYSKLDNKIKLIVEDLNIKYNTDVNHQKEIVDNILDIKKNTLDIKSVKFNGSMMDIPRMIGDGEFSIDFWLKLYDKNSNKKYIISRDSALQSQTVDNSFYYGFNIYTINNIVYFEIGDLKYNPSIISTKIELSSKYEHICVTRNKGIIKIYLNGILKDSLTTPYIGGLNSNYKGNTIRIGDLIENEFDGSYNNTPSTQYSIFSIHNLRFFNKELSDIDVINYKNNYTKLNYLIAEYNFNNINDIGNDNISNYNSLYTSSYSNETIIYNIFAILTYNKLIYYSTDFYNNTSNIVMEITNGNKKTIKYNNIQYILNDSLSYIDLATTYFDIFNDINNISISPTISNIGLYNNFYILDNYMYLLGYTKIDKIYLPTQIENIVKTTFSLNATYSFYDKIKFNTSYDSIKISDGLTASYPTYENGNYKIIFNYTTNEQSIIEIDLVDSFNTSLIQNQQYNIDIKVKDLKNSKLHISLDNVNFYDIVKEGTYNNILLTSGTYSKMYINATNILSNKKNYVNIEDILISNTYVYNYDRVVNDTFKYKSSYYTASSPINITSDVLSAYKNKFLFLDYNIGSKLTFFNSHVEYNTPNTINISATNPITTFEILTYSTNYNWISYFKDKIKNKPYLDTQNYGIEFSTTFIQSTFNSFEISHNKITKTFSNINYLMPNIATSSNTLTTISITPSNVNYDFYWHNGLLTIRATQSFVPSIGDVISINSTELAKPENGIVVYSNLYNVGGVTYSYFYINNILNETIVNNLSISGTVSVKNLNIFYDNIDLVNNLNLHYVSKCFKYQILGNTMSITPKITNETVYYNLETSIKLFTNATEVYNSTYSSSFTNFKYTPFYSLLNIMSEITDDDYNQIFYPSYEFINMSSITSILLNNSNINISDYSIIFNGTSFDSYYDNYWLYTFIDVIIYDINYVEISNNQKLLILDKQKNDNGFTIKVHKNITLPSNAYTVDVISRKTLEKISYDLNELNNIQTNKNINSIGRIDFKSDIPLHINTNSYFEIFNLDDNIRKYLTAICYTDNNNILSLNLINNDTKKSHKILNIEPYNKYNELCEFTPITFGILPTTSTYSNILYVNNALYLNSTTNKYIQVIDSTTKIFYLEAITTTPETRIITFDITLKNGFVTIENDNITTTYNYVDTYSLNINCATYSKITIYTTANTNNVLISNVSLGNTHCTTLATYSKITFDGTYSMKYNTACNINITNSMYSYYNGYNIIKETIDENSFVINKPYIDIYTMSGTVSFFKFDSHFNFTPTDISKIGSDKQINIFTKIEEKNLELVDFIQNNETSNKKKYILKDGLTIYDIYNKYKWLLEAEIEDAIIGEDANGLVWYTGKWHYGRWFGSIWYSGEWYSGEWYSGKMYSKKIEVIGDVININETDSSMTTWYDGNFYNGDIYDIIWLNGNFYNGSVNNIYWLGGNFHYGKFIASYFKNGNFINGSFTGGYINEDYGKTNWLNGILYNGYFENGTFHNGTILEKDGKSYFGSKTTNSNPAKFIKGSIQTANIGNIENNNTIIETANISYANIINTKMYNVDIKNADLKNSILDYINIVAVNLETINQYIIIEGLFDFNIGYTLFIMDNNYNYYELKVKDYKTVVNSKYTLIPIVSTTFNIITGFSNNTIPNIDNVLYEYTNYKLVSYISNVNWDGGVFNNGIFNGNVFKGLFKDGLVKSGKIN